MTKALMETEAGTVELELFDADAPGSVANFVKLAESGFYDGLAFHRVIDGFMAQGAVPTPAPVPVGCREPVVPAT